MGRLVNCGSAVRYEKPFSWHTRLCQELCQMSELIPVLEAPV